MLLECHLRLRHGMAAHIATTVAAALDRDEPRADRFEQIVEGAADYARANRQLCEVCMKYVPPPIPAAATSSVCCSPSPTCWNVASPRA